VAIADGGKLLESAKSSHNALLRVIRIIQTSEHSVSDARKCDSKFGGASAVMFKKLPKCSGRGADKQPRNTSENRKGYIEASEQSLFDS